MRVSCSVACGRLRPSSRTLHTSSLPHTTLRPMLAAVLTATTPDSDNRILMETQTVGIQRPKRGEVLVKNAACGVCYTDLHVMKKHIDFPIPAVMGHETVGEVVELGEGVSSEGGGSTGSTFSSLSIGDRVITTFIMPCGTCHHCVSRNEDICDTFFNKNRLGGTLYDGTSRLRTFAGDHGGEEVVQQHASLRHDVDRGHDHDPNPVEDPGQHRRGGSSIAMYSMAGLAEYSVVPATAVYRLPASLPFHDSAIVGCALFTAYGSVVNGGGLSHKHSENGALSAVVFGVGGVGANIVQILRAFGVKQIIAVDRAADKLELARSMGAMLL